MSGYSIRASITRLGLGAKLKYHSAGIFQAPTYFGGAGVWHWRIEESGRSESSIMEVIPNPAFVL